MLCAILHSEEWTWKLVIVEIKLRESLVAILRFPALDYAVLTLERVRP